MRSHRFAMGARVQYRSPLRHLANAAGDYVVARLLPADAQGNRYRVQHCHDGHERVVHEIDLSGAANSGGD